MSFVIAQVQPAESYTFQFEQQIFVFYLYNILQFPHRQNNFQIQIYVVFNKILYFKKFNSLPT